MFWSIIDIILQSTSSVCDRWILQSTSSVCDRWIVFPIYCCALYFIRHFYFFLSPPSTYSLLFWFARLFVRRLEMSDHSRARRRRVVHSGVARGTHQPETVPGPWARAQTVDLFFVDVLGGQRGTERGRTETGRLHVRLTEVCVHFDTCVHFMDSYRFNIECRKLAVINVSTFQFNEILPIY